MWVWVCEEYSGMFIYCLEGFMYNFFVDLIKRSVLSLVAEIIITIIPKHNFFLKPSALYKKHDGGWGVGGWLRYMYKNQ